MTTPITGRLPEEQGPVLTADQIERYSRHILLEEVGVAGQQRLLEAKALVVGAGGLGSPAAIYLAAAGVGTIGIIDGDRVDRSNLQRQVLHFERDVGQAKTASAQAHLTALNRDVKVIEHTEMLSAANALAVIGAYDLVIGGADNFPTRYLLSDACVLLQKPLVDASILRFEGQAAVFLPGRGCYRCLYPEPPPPGAVPSCAEAGIIGALAGHMGTLQALEAVKVLVGIGEPLANRLLLFDALSGEYRSVRWRRDPACPVCGDAPTITELVDYQQFCGLTKPLADLPVTAAAPAAADTRPLLGAAIEIGARQAAPYLDDARVQWIDVREEHEYRRRHIPGSRLVPLAQLPQRVGEIDPARPAIYLCAAGARSLTAAAAMRRAGVAHAYSLQGGLAAWVSERLPVEAEK